MTEQIPWLVQNDENWGRDTDGWWVHREGGWQVWYRDDLDEWRYSHRGTRTIRKGYKTFEQAAIAAVMEFPQ